jgi:hypothetical protein
MVTGTGVGVADAEDTEPIAKQPSTSRIVPNVMFNFFIFLIFPFVVLAFFGPETFRGQFWPFIGVLREICSPVTRKVGEF